MTTTEQMPAWLARRPVRRLLVLSWHIVGILLAVLGAFFLRFDFAIPAKHLPTLLETLPVACLIYLAAFYLFRLNSGLWVYFSLDDIQRTGQAILCGTGFLVLYVFLSRGLGMEGFPRSVLVSQMLILSAWEMGGRFSVRALRRRLSQERSDQPATPPCLVVGNVQQADLVIRRLRDVGGVMGPVAGVLTDDDANEGLRIHGVRITSPIHRAGDLVKQHKVGMILLLPPYTGPQAIKRVMSSCTRAEVKCDFRVVPDLEDIASGRLDVSTLRKVSIEDLLNREPARFDRGIIADGLGGRRVLVSGAGGSIGSEICRQVAAHQPAGLVLLERSEVALFHIERELRRQWPDLPLQAVLGDVARERDCREALACAGGPVDLVIHAAAYKHVTLLEGNVAAAFRNNVLGSDTLAEAAQAAGVPRFILVSTDKAVRPRSVMGTTKRMAERVVLEREPQGTTFVAVRFGNVLDSSGSVVPLFARQIADNGPVTVTGPEVRRFFMTIPEAVELVLMAGIVGDRGQIMVLEMGEPVKILDLARRMIELSGLVPDRDIPITFIGLRPGEKELEELMTDDENVVRTAHDKIWVVARHGDRELHPIDRRAVREALEAEDDDRLLGLARAAIADHQLDLPPLVPVIPPAATSRERPDREAV